MAQKLMRIGWLRVNGLVERYAKVQRRQGTAWRIAACVLAVIFAVAAGAQAVSTTTVQGTVYLANGQAGTGTLLVSWPAFTTAAGQAVAADSTTVPIGADGFVSVNLAPNVGATPAGEYYTAVFYMSDGSTSTQYWVVPAAAQATLAQVKSQVMPAAQAVQAVSKAYVDQSVAELTQSLLTASGGNLSGPLYLNGDPTQALQATDKHYVDTQVGTAVPLAGGNMTGALTAPAVNAVQSPMGSGAQGTLQAAINAAGTTGAMVIPPNYAGTDTFTNQNGVRVTDLRATGAQPTERSVKEFGAVCNGVTDDTNALQAALNYANAHGVALTIPQGTCKTRTLSWHGESIGGAGKQVSALMGFPGEDVLASGPDAMNMLSSTRLHDLTIYVDQSVDVSCSPAEGRAAAGSCQLSRQMEANSIFSAGGNGLTNTAGTGAGWWVGNCAIAMQAATGGGGNGLRVAEIENVAIAATGADPMSAQYPGAHSTHTCGMYLAQWPQWSEFRNIDVRGVNTGIAVPALPVTAPAGLNADSNRWQNVTIQATHAFTAAAGSNNVLDNVVAMAGNSAATGEPPTGLVLDLGGNGQTPQQGWTVRNAVVMPTWNAVQPQLTVTAAGGAVSGVAPGTEHGLGWDPYGTSVPLTFSGACTAQATAQVNSDGSIGSVTVSQGGVGCSSTTTASVNAAGTWDTAAPVNLIAGQDMTFFAGNLLKGAGGYTVWNATSSASYGTALDSGGGVLPGGGSYAALTGGGQMGTVFEVDQFPGVDLGAKLQACANAVNGSYGGTCDARNFTGNQQMGANLTIATGNVTVLLPCATITTAKQILVTAGTRNVSLRGCALRGGTAASGSQGGTVFAYSGASSMVRVGDPTYGLDTPGFHLDDVVINTTSATSATAQAFVAYRTQELDLESLYLLGNSTQTGMTLDGTGNYTGGTFLDDQLSGFGTAVNAIGHQVANPATTDWMNASAFVRLHIDCPTSNGSPISGTYGINLEQGDGNTFTGGDVEGCSTALHLGANAQNNTLVGLRNENSTNQVVADGGSAYNNWITGGTMFTGKLTDNGTRNSFLDTFHRSFNGLNGDWYGSQQDATVTNHYRLGTGNGNERGLLNRYQTDYGYRWTTGLSDATAGEQFYQVLDELNSVYRLSIGQNNSGQSSTNNQTVINAAGSGAVVLNGSNNAGTGGLIVGSGGPSETTVATISNGGNAQFNGTLQVAGTSQSAGTMTVRNNADAEVDYYLWPGLTASQKGAFTYKDWNGNSQWYMVKDASNNWALNSASGGLDSFKAYQSTNSGDTYIDSSNSAGHVRLNYETGSGAETDIYSGSSANLDAAFLGPTSIKFPGLATSSGQSCLQIDSSGYLTNTGSACGSGSGGANGTVNSGNSGQIAYYTANGATVGGMNAVPVASGGTGAATASAALANLGGQQTIPVTAYGAVGDCTGTGSTTGCTDNATAIQNAINAAYSTGAAVYFPFNPASASGQTVYYTSHAVNPEGVSMYGPPGAAGQSMAYASVVSVGVRGAPGKDVFEVPDPGANAPVMRHGFTVRDIGIIVDDTVNASASFPNRFPGRFCFDAVGNGTTVVTSALQCRFKPGDVGQTMKVGTTTTAIVSWQSATQVTVADNVSSGTGLTAYISVVGLPVTQTVGNCAFAMDASGVAGGYGNGPLRANFTDVVIQSVVGRQYYTCGYYFQGNTGPYQTKWDHDQVAGYFGFVFAPANTAAGSVGYDAPGIGDFNDVDNTWVVATIPWISYGGNDNKIAAMQISGAVYGPQILDGNGAADASGAGVATEWHIDIPEMEGAASCPTGVAPTTFRITGTAHMVDRMATIYCGSGTQPIFQWDASNSNITDLDLAGVSTFAVSGDLNTFKNPFFAVNIPQSYNITGAGNTLITCTSSSIGFGVNPGACQYAGLGSTGDPATTFGPPQLAHGRIALNRTSDFIRNGAANYYFNDADLWIYPDTASSTDTKVPWVSDSASKTGEAIQVVGTTAIPLTGADGTPWYWGYQVPAGKVRYYIVAKANAAIAWSTSLASYSSGTGYNGLCSISPTLTTSYAVYECDGDATAYANTDVYMQLGAPGAGNTVSVAWIGIRPWPTDWNVNGPVNAAAFQVGGSPFGTANLADWTNAGLANGDVSIWNSATNKWTPGVVNATQVNGGSVPASANVLATNSSNQPIAATAHNLSSPRTCMTANGGNAFTCTTSPSFTPAPGDAISVNFNAANTATATLAVNGGSAYTIYKNGGTQTLSAGDLQPNHWVSAILDSNNHWQLEGQLGNVNATQINGGSAPASALALSTNSSGQLVSMPVPALTAAASTTSTSLTSTGIVFPSVPASTTVHGTCAIIWEGSSTSYSTTFGMGANNAPTDLWVLGTMHGGSNGATSADKYSTITNTTVTAVTTAGTPGAASTGYRAEIDFTLVTGANPVTLTLYYESSNGSGTSYVEPGSACWLM